MTRERWMLVAGLGLVLIGIAASEDVARRIAQQRYQAAVMDRERLEGRVRQIIASHGQMKNKLVAEQQRSLELLQTLASTRGQLEQAMGRWSEEAKQARTSQQRLTSMQQQLEQLQGELAMAVQPRATGAEAHAQPVQLERIVVSDPASSATKGRVVSVHRDWNFVVIDLGWNDVKIGELISIFRNDQLLAKAKVERVQEQVSAATILPEWDATNVQTNDLVRPL